MEININTNVFQIHQGSHKIALDHINSGLWEPYTFAIFDFFTSENDIVIDLGCWNGVTSLYLANKAGTVYAIDADPICFLEISKNCSLNPHLSHKIKPFNLAISDKNGKINLFARENYGASSTSILERKRDKLSSVQIDALTMNDFITKEKINQVDFIKMDIEGAEFLIIPTFEEALKKMKYPTLYISFHYTYLNENLYAKYINSRVLTKVILKIEQVFKVSFLKYTIKRSLKELFTDLHAYQFIYSHTGVLFTFEEIQKNPLLIKHNELIFTNKKWEK